MRVLAAVGLAARELHQPMPVIEAWSLHKLFTMAELAKVMSGKK